jgi:hypothetical protein
MVRGFGQDLGNNAALFGNPQAALGAKGFDVDRLVHEYSVQK